MMFQKLTTVNRQIIYQINEILKNFNLNSSDWRIFVYLSKHKSSTSTAISDYYKMDRAIVSRLIAKLVNMGFIVLVTSENDKREKLIELSSSGKEVFFDANVLIKEYEKKICEQLSAGELVEFINILDKINNNL